MYVIHQPYHDYFGAWKAMEELYAQGRVRAISVDNFTQDRLADFMFWNQVRPAANLLECNPYFQRPDEAAYLKSEAILMQAWSPLAAGQDGVLNGLCQGVGKGSDCQKGQAGRPPAQSRRPKAERRAIREI